MRRAWGREEEAGATAGRGGALEETGERGTEEATAQRAEEKTEESEEKVREASEER